MKLFVTGSQDSEFIKDTLDDLHEDFCITEIIGSALSPCMEVVSDWCDELIVPLTLYLPESVDSKGAFRCNKDCLILGEPHFVLLYNESTTMSRMLLTVAKSVESIQFVAHKAKE